MHDPIIADPPRRWPWQTDRPGLVLASASSTRAGLLRAAGLAVTTRAAQVDEAAVKQAMQHAASPEAVALALADAKACDVAATLSAEDEDALVIGADQMLCCGDDWFDKPQDRHGALAQLRRLRGRTHVLHSAVACRRHGRLLWQHVAQPRLTMRAVPDTTLEAYLDLEGGAVLDSVGAYRIEGPGLLLFEHIEGEHSAILGLPMLALCGFLREFGVLAA